MACPAARGTIQPLSYRVLVAGARDLRSIYFGGGSISQPTTVAKWPKGRGGPYPPWNYFPPGTAFAGSIHPAHPAARGRHPSAQGHQAGSREAACGSRTETDLRLRWASITINSRTVTSKDLTGRSGR